MKKLFALFFALSFFISSCGKKAEEGTHTHEDGSTHAAHLDSTKQQTPTPVDSVEQDSIAHGHPHEH